MPPALSHSIYLLEAFMVYVALSLTEGLPGGSVEMNLPAKQGTTGDSGSSLIPGSGRFPQKAMATHSSTLAWRIPWAEEPGGLQSMGLQRIRHNRSDLAHTLPT